MALYREKKNAQLFKNERELKKFFKNDSLEIDETGKTESQKALEQMDPTLKGMFRHFNKEDFADFVRQAWQVNEENKKVPQTAENQVIMMKNASIIMAGLDVLDFSIRRVFYIGEKEITPETVNAVVAERLKHTAYRDTIFLAQKSAAQSDKAQDITKVFSFKKVMPKALQKDQITRAGNMSITQKFPNFVFIGNRWRHRGS